MTSGEIRIGALATLVGPYAAMGQEAMRGVDLAIAEFGGQVAGKSITVIKEGTNAMPEDAEMMADMLLNKHRVDFIVGPLSGNEGMAVRDYAKTHPERAFVNGCAAPQDMCLRHTAPNFYNFILNGVQMSAGLAAYVFNTKGYRRIATLGEDYSYPHAQIGGLIVEFCRIGGQVVEKFWVPLGTTDYTPIIRAIPDDIDAIYVVLAGTDAVNFLKQYDMVGGTKPLVGGAVMADPVVLNVKGKLSERLVGMAASAPVAEDNPSPAWQAFVQQFRQHFPNAGPAPSLFTNNYYTNAKAALLALQQVEGDLSNGQERFKQALNRLQFNSPPGR
jgi:branched-chain amino acid transport system substrate-binding protein